MLKDFGTKSSGYFKILCYASCSAPVRFTLKLSLKFADRKSQGGLFHSFTAFLILAFFILKSSSVASLTFVTETLLFGKQK